MEIRTIGFNPLRVTADSIEVPVEMFQYDDEDGFSRLFYYVVVNGEKIPIQGRVELMERLAGNKVEYVFAKIAEDRVAKIEALKNKI